MDEHGDRAPGTVTSGESCQVCGAETRGDEPLCDTCSRTADTIAETPLPPIPDGGLARAMPGWLRSSPQSAVETTPTPPPAPNEFASILSDEDIPVWLKRMAERHAAERAPATVVTESAAPAPAASPVQPAPSGAAAPTTPPAAVGERRVMVGAVPPRPIDPTPFATLPSRKMRLPAVETRTVIGVGILAAIVAVVILVIVLFG
jgi:hypothetical protein